MSLTTTRCKFRCYEIVDHGGGMRTVRFRAVTGDSPENKSFWHATPQGSMEFSYITACEFEVNSDYYLDISLAPK